MSTTSTDVCKEASYGRVVACMAKGGNTATPKSGRGGRADTIADAPGVTRESKGHVGNQAILRSAH